MLLSLDARQSHPEPAIYDDPDGYAVLSFLLDHAMAHSEQSVQIFSTTTNSDQLLKPHGCGQFPDAFQAAQLNFNELNKTNFRLLAKFAMKAKYDLVEKAEKETPPPAGPGEQQLNPDSFLQSTLFIISAVGFDKDKTHAIAYVSGYCGAMCASGGYHALIKQKQGWKEISDSPKCEWMSATHDSPLSRGAF